MAADVVVDEVAPFEQCWLYRCEDHSPFAYARGCDFIRVADHTLWAYLRDDRLVSARSGHTLAYRVGRVFHNAVTHKAMYYVPSSLTLPEGPIGTASAVRAQRSATRRHTTVPRSHAGERRSA